MLSLSNKYLDFYMTSIFFAFQIEFSDNVESFADYFLLPKKELQEAITVLQVSP